MPAVGVKIDGVREVKAALRKLGASTDPALETAARQSEKGIASEARQEAPRRSGDLAASILPTGKGLWPEVGAGTRGVRYAGPIHFGWPTRGLHRADDATLDAVRAAIGQGTQAGFGARAVRKIDRRRASVASGKSRRALARGGPIAPNPFLYRAADARIADINRQYESAMAALIAASPLGD